MLKQNIEDVKSTLQEYKFPVDVIIETIAYCNLRCIMCPQSKLIRPRGEMSMDLYKKIVGEVAKESPITRIWPSGLGEPLLLGDKMIAMVKYASYKGLSVCFNTNGNLLDPVLAEKLVDANPKEFIFGIDAVTPETYDKIRIGGSYQKVVENILHLLKIKKNNQGVSVQFIEMDENSHEIEAFKKYWLGNGVTVKLRPKLGWGTAVSTGGLQLPESERIPCAWLTRTATIQWDGHMSQCDSDYEGRYSPGDLNVQTLKKVWNGELAKRRKRQWSGDFSYLCCATCKDWQVGRSHYFYPKGTKND